MILKILNKKKGVVEKALQFILEVLYSYTTVLLSVNGYKELEKKFDMVLGLEVDFENAFQGFNDQLKNRFYVPFYWEDLYSIGVCLRKIFNLLIMYYNKALIYRNEISYRVLLKTHLELFDNTKSFLREYLKNRKYSQELLKNNRHLLKSYLRSYFELVNSRLQDTHSFERFYEIRELFEKMITEHENINNLLNKILIGIE